MSDENEPSWLAEATNPINPSSRRREEDPNSPSWAFTHKDKFVRKQLPPEENVDDHNPSWVREPSAVGHSSSSSGFRRGSPEGEGDEHCCCQYCYDCEHSIEGCCCGPTDPLLWWFHIISFFAGATALASMGASVKLLYSEGITIRNLMLRGYSVLFCTIALTLELDIKFFVSRLAALDIWFFRGLFYIFIGLITSEYCTKYHMTAPLHCFILRIKLCLRTHLICAIKMPFIFSRS